MPTRLPEHLRGLENTEHTLNSMPQEGEELSGVGGRLGGAQATGGPDRPGCVQGFETLPKTSVARRGWGGQIPDDLSRRSPFTRYQNKSQLV